MLNTSIKGRDGQIVGGICSGHRTDPEMIERFGDMILWEIADALSRCDAASQRHTELQREYALVANEVARQGQYALAALAPPPPEPPSARVRCVRCGALTLPFQGAPWRKVCPRCAPPWWFD